MGFESMKHLLQNGHRNIGIIGLDSTVFSYRELLGGFRDAMEQYDMDFDKLPKLMSDSMQISPNSKPYSNASAKCSCFGSHIS